MARAPLKPASDDREVRRALERWRRGEDPEGAFRVLVEAYDGRLCRFFESRGARHEEAADLTQETFVRIYTSLDGFRREASFETWLFTVATNVLRQSRRRRGTLKRGAGAVVESLEEQVHEPRTTGDDPLDRAMERQRTHALRQALEELPPRMRAVLKLRVYHGRSRRQIADALGVSEETVKAQLHQARRRLADALKPPEDAS